MKAPATIAMLMLSAVPPAAADAVGPAAGKFLVATGVIRGPTFAESVILLLHYDATGAAGLIVNRRTDVALDDALSDLDAADGYDGSLYYGGPVQPYTLRALQRSDRSPDDALHLVDDVYLVPLRDDLFDDAPDEEALRFYIGYAGWSPGQLDEELSRGSWSVVAATADLVFAPDPERTWRRLAPPELIRASLR